MGAPAKRKGHNRAARLRRRLAPAIDQVYDDVHDSERLRRLRHEQPLDVERPGLGQFYCAECARYFISAGALRSHGRTKAHKRRVKLLHTEKPYTCEEAEWAAGVRRDAPAPSPSSRL